MNELIDALRICSSQPCCDNCPRYDKDHAQETNDCCVNLLTDAADAIEADEKHINELTTKCNQLQAAVDNYEKRIAELEAQLPKEGEWIEANTRPRSAQFYCSACHRNCYDIQPTRDKAWTKRCRYNYCPNCGSVMKGGCK